MTRRTGYVQLWLDTAKSLKLVSATLDAKAMTAN
jgi:hypothetical protein